MSNTHSTTNWSEYIQKHPLQQALDVWQRELSARLTRLEEQVRKMPARTRTSHTWTPEVKDGHHQ